MRLEARSQKSALIGRATFDNVGALRVEIDSISGPIIVKGGNHAVWRMQNNAIGGGAIRRIVRAESSELLSPFESDNATGGSSREARMRNSALIAGAVRDDFWGHRAQARKGSGYTSKYDNQNIRCAILKT